MLNVKFPDYSYAKVVFDGFEVNKDGEVVVSLSKLDKEAYTLENDDYEYAGNDFYKFVPTEEVEVLVNEKDETLLTMVSTGADKIVEGLKAEIDDEYDAIADDDYDYVYALIEKRDAEESTQLRVESMYLYDIELSKSESNITLNENDGKISSLSRSKIGDVEDWDDENLLIIDGERASLKDLEVGTTISRVTLLRDGREVKNTTFYMVSDATETGKFTKLDDDTLVATIGGEKYAVDPKATYVEDPEDEDEKQTKSLLDDATSDMNKEEVTMYLDAFRRIARLDFDGNIGDDDSSTYGFYVVKADVERETSKSYYMELENEDGTETKYFAEKAKSAAQKFYNDQGKAYTLEDGDFVMVEFNDEDEILSVKRLAWFDISGDTATESGDKHSGETEDDTYVAAFIKSGDYEDEKEEIRSGETGTYKRYADVDDDTVVVTISYDEDEEEVTYTIETGIDAVEDIGKEPLLVVYDADDDIETALYVVRYDSAKNSSAKEAGILEEVSNNVIANKYFEVTIDGEEYLAKLKDVSIADLKPYEDGVVVFSTSEVEKEDLPVIDIKSKMKASDLQGLENAKAVVNVTSKKIKFTNDADSYTLKEVTSNLWDGYTFVQVSVDPDEEESEDVVNSVNAITEDDLTLAAFSEDDRISVDSTGKVLYIVDGYKEPNAPATPAGPEDPGEVVTGGWDPTDCLDGSEHIDEMVSTVTKEYVNGKLTLKVTNAEGEPDDICDICGAKHTSTAVAVTDAVEAYEYEDEYEYAGTFTAEGDTVTYTVADTEAIKDGVSTFSADTARFLGGLYRAAGVEEIKYDGTSYTWEANDDGNYLKGSNFRDSEGTTLVSVLRTAQKGGETSFELTLNGEEVLNYVLGE